MPPPLRASRPARARLRARRSIHWRDAPPLPRSPPAPRPHECLHPSLPIGWRWHRRQPVPPASPLPTVARWVGEARWVEQRPIAPVRRVARRWNDSLLRACLPSFLAWVGITVVLTDTVHAIILPEKTPRNAKLYRLIA